MEHCISETIEGFLMQKTGFSFEIIIFDDASTDQTAEIIKSYGRKYPGQIFPVLESQNQYRIAKTGLADIYNRYLFANARGCYIAMSDGDDYWTDPLKLQKQVDYLESNSNTAACFTNAIVINEIEKTEHLYHISLEEGLIPVETVLMRGGGLYPTSSLVFRKNALLSSPLFPGFQALSAELAGDTLLIYTLAYQGGIGYINQTMTVYRQSGSGLYTSMKGDRSMIAERQERQIKGLKKLKGFLGEKDVQVLKRKISVEALFVIRNSRNRDRYRYLGDLNYREFVKLCIHRK
jgi:glycosyltransferase involved in cell wall biosynthesis